MSDTIQLRELRVMAFCGVLPEEIERRQPFSIDVDVETDLGAAGRSDDLDQTIDYGTLVDGITSLADSGRFNLLERFATEIADVALSHDGVDAVTVTIHKVRPPVAHDLGRSGVSIRRTVA